MIEGQKKCIGLIFGGNSNEHEVSISSAKTVYKAFNSETNKERFTVKAFYINKYGYVHRLYQVHNKLESTFLKNILDD